MPSAAPAALPDNPAITFDDVQRAAERIKGHAIRTPVLTNPMLDELVGHHVMLKAENLQRTGAFKFRGGCNSLMALDDTQRTAGVVTYSSGNHGRAIATAAALVNSSSVVVMPQDAPPEKVSATAAAGARIVRYDRYAEDRSEIAGRIAEEDGRLIIPPYDWPDVIAGQGTAALELFEQVDNVDALVVCLGGGGFLAGCSTVAAQVSPQTRIFGVEPAEGDDHVLSRARNERVQIEVPRTIADGQQTVSPGELTWPITNALVEEFLTVHDDEIVSTMATLFADAKIVAEPSGASALAAVLHGRLPELEPGSRIAVTISGGNISQERFAALCKSA